MNAFVECHKSPCIHVCEQNQEKKKKQDMRNGISSYLPTGRAGDTTMVWVRLTHKHRENESRTEQRDRKKRMKIRNGWSGTGVPAVKFGGRLKVKLGHQQHVMAWASRVERLGNVVGRGNICQTAPAVKFAWKQSTQEKSNLNYEMNILTMFKTLTDGQERPLPHEKELKSSKALNQTCIYSIVIRSLWG